jgi:predicted transcriptional regulator
MVLFALKIITDGQLRAARGFLGWSQSELASRAGVTLGTIHKLEKHHGTVGCRADTLARVTAALEDAGIRFITEDIIGIKGRRGAR